MTSRLQFVLTLASILAYPAGALAIGWCEPRESMVLAITEAGQSPHLMLLTDSGSVIEIYLNEQSEAFTVLRTKPGGESCVIAKGQGLEHIAIPCDPRRGCNES